MGLPAANQSSVNTQETRSTGAVPTVDTGELREKLVKRDDLFAEKPYDPARNDYLLHLWASEILAIVQPFLDAAHEQGVKDTLAKIKADPRYDTGCMSCLTSEIVEEQLAQPKDKEPTDAN